MEAKEGRSCWVWAEAEMGRGWEWLEAGEEIGQDGSKGDQGELARVQVKVYLANCHKIYPMIRREGFLVETAMLLRAANRSWRRICPAGKGLKHPTSSQAPPE